MARQWTERLGGAGSPRAAGPEGFVAGVELTGDDLRRARRWLTISGILALVAGAVAIVVPDVASVTVALLVGWVLIFAGIVMGMHAWMVRAREPVGWRFLEAALTLILGISIVVFPRTGTFTLTFFLAVWFFASGVMLLAVAMQQRGVPGNWLLVLNGVVSVILGALIVADLPSSADWAIGLLVGINLIFFGVRALFAASLLKRVLPT